MFKRLFTIALAILMMASCMPFAFADRTSDIYKKDTENIYNLWGDFETEAQAAQASTSGIADPYRGWYKSTVLSHISDGADNSKGSIKVDMASADSDDYINFHFPAVSFETYDISFWLKTEAQGATDISLMIEYFMYDDTQELVIPLVASDGKWYKYTCTWTCEDRDPIAWLDSGASNIRIALKGVSDAYTFYIDRLSVKPYGKDKEWDYSSVNVYYNSLMGTTPPEPVYGNTDTNPFEDISSHWARETVRGLAAYGLINGMGDGTFAPDKNVTRAEFIKMAVGTIADAPEKVVSDKWYVPYIEQAMSYGLIPDEMKKGESVLPETPITREEAAAIVAKVAEHKGAKKGKGMDFTDESAVSDWAKEAVSAASAYGIINGYEDGTFKPNGKITRAEAAQMLYKVVEFTDRIGIYVDADSGNDKNNGTKEAPLKTVTAARDMAMKYSDKMKSDLFIFIKGEHYFDDSFTLNEYHSGKNGHDIVYTSWGEEKPIFTMAKKYTDFTIHDEDKNIWKTYVGVGTYSRQAYFNDVRGIRSRQVGYLTNCELIKGTEEPVHYLCDNTELLDIRYPAELDAVYHAYWTNNRYMVKSIKKQGDKVRIDFGDYFQQNNYRVIVNDNRNPRIHTPSYLENAYEFLDQAGEWYLNKHDGYMYYIPRSGEDMSTMECKIPQGVKLMDAQGSTYANKLENITFDNILFEGTTRFDIDEKGGFAPVQNDLLTGTNEGGNDGKLGEAVGGGMEFARCENITFTNNMFRHMGLACLELIEGASYITIEGNEFRDTSSHALLIDDASVSGSFGRKEEKLWCEYYEINNNLFTHTGMDYNGSAAVGIAYVRHFDFEHNQISYSGYSGVHLGWAWSVFQATGSINYDIDINYNYIHDFMFGRVNDGAAIYNVCGGSRENDSIADAPGKGINKNRIMGNYIVNAWNSDCIYPDQGSSNIYVANNVADTGVYKINETWNFDNPIGYPHTFYWSHMHSKNISYMTYENNYSDRDYDYWRGMMNQLESSVEPTKIYPNRNWPDEALQIIENAGIEEKYRKNFDLDGAKVLKSNDQWQNVRVGEPTDPGLYIWDYNIDAVSLDDYDLRWWFSDPEALTYENGKIVAHKVGTFEAEVFAVVDGVEMSQHYVFDCYENVDALAFSQETLNMLEGKETPLTISATLDGITSVVTGMKKLTVDVKSENPEIADIRYVEDERRYMVTANTKGKTKITGTLTYDGVEFPVDMDVTIVTYGSKEAESLPYREVNFYQGWSDGATPVEGGTMISALPAYWTSEKISNELIAFDMEINPGNGWPSIAFCSPTTKGDYNQNNNYMIGFKSEFIELQRWVGGVRKYFFGSANLNPVSGEGYPTVGENPDFAYNKRVSVIVGALDTPEGTRLVLTINGKNIFDYIDNSTDRLPAEGYFALYNPAPGGTTIYPFTGITNE